MHRQGDIGARSSKTLTPRTITRTQKWLTCSTRMLTRFPHVADLSRLAWVVTSCSRLQSKKGVKIGRLDNSKQSKNRLPAPNFPPSITPHVSPCLTVRKRQISRAKIDSNSLEIDLIENNAYDNKINTHKFNFYLHLINTIDLFQKGSLSK